MPNIEIVMREKRVAKAETSLKLRKIEEFLDQSLGK
jgi:hypothetical protein